MVSGQRAGLDPTRVRMRPGPKRALAPSTGAHGQVIASWSRRAYLPRYEGACVRGLRHALGIRTRCTKPAG